MNDYAWMQLHAQRESEHRARARHRGGDDTTARPASARWLRLRLGRHLAAARPAPMPSAAASSSVAPAAAVTAAAPAMTAAMRGSASDAPTAAAVAWARLASGAGNLEPATWSRTEPERDAA